MGIDVWSPFYNHPSMLPSSLQSPAAIVLVLGGLLACFAGYRVFRIVLGIYGFILGALMASSFMGPDNTLYLVLAALGGGIAGALVLIAAYFVGVALIGAGAGAVLSNVAWAAMDREPHVAVVVICAVGGALLALALQRYVIIFSTSLGGAWTAIVGALALAGDRAPVTATSRTDVWIPFPVSPDANQRWVMIAWIAVGIVGVIVQLSVTAKGRK
jgi:hypothetical protein